jgi:hypothetical protein
MKCESGMVVMLSRTNGRYWIEVATKVIHNQQGWLVLVPELISFVVQLILYNVSSGEDVMMLLKCMCLPNPSMN